MKPHMVASMDEDRMGFIVPKCSCKWKGMPCPDTETAVDVLMEHAYAMGTHESAGYIQKDTPR